MSKLNGDILYLIFKELEDDKMTLISCLSVNKIWCEIIIPIFWNDPWKYLSRGREKLLLEVIISHLSDESRDNLSKYLIKSFKKPLFNYISFCKILNLIEIEKIIYISIDYNFLLDISLLKEEIFNLFINNKAKFTHLYMPYGFNYQIHLIPGAKESFSEIEFLNFNAGIDEKILIGLSEICKSIKKLDFFIQFFVKTNNNDGIIRLIDSQKKLNQVYFELDYDNVDESFCKNLENSLIKHGKTIEYIKIVDQPITNILSYFENLKILEVIGINYNALWDELATVSLPFLQLLNVKNVPINVLTSLIEKTKGYLNEIKIGYIDHDEIDNKRLIRAIYQNCPNLKYLKLLIKDSNIWELEKLLINCKYLDGLFIMTEDHIDWVELFKILTRSSPTSLFKFKFYFSVAPRPEFLKLFFDNWKSRHSMLLYTIPEGEYVTVDIDYCDMIEKYKAEGVIKVYHNSIFGVYFEDFEWIRKKNSN
ncbi:uncharacterized protein OCT59_015881 [Rhizophagus irregularis]|uniref:F-box domain-containing protein n=3 Tax=Rhizophagus irregularis TaxID=588596 RepID=A0A2H5SK84_RHIID|nr:hypothetical protein GLOIN_2v1780770 [Rhizophagus irregularis DAOM 181602=DAOM 197198]POG66273.1 hypothetical protein GLOIN_2v1780770 [Rhizophagus irregularis DAOM 181602=DAOM 197198]UZO23547.1 hypothetical protein OCT59_015881 [Rhizophagus irregularis]GBC30733.1 hypothetical protein GLOIN_2v1780770 [Rhizophagus irregularis DAOM 181602=DAOM 197198]|eukprot:XP_025173139.1 hypothetical protein GLOIN_2v1780770 [Rhizophagus irregularis DAOM 181602=DAOM 197198]